MKLFTLLTFFYLFTFSNNYSDPTELQTKVLQAIVNEDYEYIETVIKNKTIKSTDYIEGKPLAIHAAIHNKPEMILLLAQYAALLYECVCVDGKDIMQYAKENNSIHAQAQIILIRA
jgi:hypothetical protein|tara:strand:- start:312 stop:662 length:351 start_codon:yes stop_codon:yes gene_type:complete